MSERKTMFGEAKSKKYAEIVRLDSIPTAKQSARILMREFEDAETRDKKVRVKKVTVNASNRARASAKRKNLSAKERKELNEIAGIYENTYEKMELPKRR